MAATAIQLYTLRNWDVSFTTILERVAEVGFDGVEYAFRVTEADPAAVRETLAETGLSVPSAHVDVEVLEADLDAAIDRYRDLQCERLVVPMLTPEDFASVDATRATAHRLESLAEDVADCGLPLSYHNHHFEFTDVDGRFAYEILIEETDTLSFELDVGLAAYAGGNPAGLIETYTDRIELLHCTDAHFDADDPGHASFGTADVDYETVLAAAEEGGTVDWLVYENGSHDDSESELEHAREAFIER